MSRGSGGTHGGHQWCKMSKNAYFTVKTKFYQEKKRCGGNSLSHIVSSNVLCNKIRCKKDEQELRGDPWGSPMVQNE